MGVGVKGTGMGEYALFSQTGDERWNGVPMMS